MTLALQLTDLAKTFEVGKRLLRPPKAKVRAVQPITLDVETGETLGIVGESGSGKSTVGRAIVRLVEADSGEVILDAQDMNSLSAAELRSARRRVQMIFQDPYASLNPRKRILHALSEGPIVQGVPKAQAHAQARELLEIVELDAGAADRYPHEFSGGQRQRIGIARALAMDPDLIIADEAVSALDVSIQAQVLDLLRDLQKRLSLSLMFITHDMRVAAQLCDRVAVMQNGKLVEIGPVSEVFLSPKEDYTRSLLAAVPRTDWQIRTAS